MGTLGSNTVVLPGQYRWNTGEAPLRDDRKAVGGVCYIGMHSFTNGDGSAPRGELLFSGNALYGTTYVGGRRRQRNCVPAQHQRIGLHHPALSAAPDLLFLRKRVFCHLGNKATAVMATLDGLGCPPGLFFPEKRQCRRVLLKTARLLLTISKNKFERNRD